MSGRWKWLSDLLARSAPPPPGTEAEGAARIDPADLPGPGWNDAIIWWLERQDRRALHRLALGWNWDRSTRPLRYIVDRPDCDKGTALTIFFMGEPERFASHNRSGPYHNPGFQPLFTRPLQLWNDDTMGEEELWLLRRISENWAAGHYKTFDFYPGEDAVHWLTRHPVEARPSPANMPWPVPVDLVTAVPQGEVVDTGYDQEGCPSELCEALERRPDIHP